MQQRQPRLGDILDDYCPRERRITNHAVVAMIESEIKQTRCTTCEAEHEYKQAKIPPQRKKKDGPGALVAEALTTAPRRPGTVVTPPVEATAAEPTEGADDAADALPLEAAIGDDGEPEIEGPVHRQLIWATLPRPEGVPKERPIPEFTIRAATKPVTRFRPGGGGGGPRRGGAPGGADIGNSFNFRGRRGNAGAPAGQAAQGNRARPAQGGERQGQPHARRRGGKKRAKS
jgi:hypothetical protein